VDPTHFLMGQKQMNVEANEWKEMNTKKSVNRQEMNIRAAESKEVNARTLKADE
jgi:hypothetical protein